MNKQNKIFTISITVIIIVVVIVVLAINDVASTSLSSFDKSISDGNVKVSYPSADFGLATTQDQILVKSYIPSCDGAFNYCLYYIGTKYAGTNFESAGIRVTKRADLGSETSCTETLPEGFSSLRTPVLTTHEKNYASSVFGDIGDAAVGHFAVGTLYRLFVIGNTTGRVTATSSTCYEFETRIGQTRFENYPPGAIKEFTAADATAMQAVLKQIVQGISIPTGEKNLFR